MGLQSHMTVIGSLQGTVMTLGSGFAFLIIVSVSKCLSS